jgi:[ribosomal protein S5]-alanine N-acetyltransferase
MPCSAPPKRERGKYPGADNNRGLPAGIQAVVKLRRLEWGDFDAVHALLSRMDVVRHMLLPLCSPAESEKFLRDSLLESPSDPRRSFVRATGDCPSGHLVGLCGAVIPRGAEEGEIWYLVDPESWGKGIATEAARQLLDFGFWELGLHRIWATCVPENPASARVLEKVGMRQQGFHVESLKIHGVWKSCFLYAMLAEEWTCAVETPR